MEALSPSSSTVAPHLRLLQQVATAKEQIHHYAQNSSIRGYPPHRRGLYNPSLGNALRLNTEANLVTGMSEPELLPHAKGFQQFSKAETHHFNLEMEVANVIPATIKFRHIGGFDGPPAATAAHHGQADLDLNRDDDDRIDSVPYISHFLDATTTASSVTNFTIADVNPPDMAVPPTDSSHYDNESVEVASTLVSDAWSTIANYGP